MFFDYSKTMRVFALRSRSQEKAYAPKDNEEIYGTWVNEKYDGAQSGRPKRARSEWKSDGTFAIYQKSYHDKPALYGTYSITEKWTDKGDVWYKVAVRIESYKRDGYSLVRISDSGSTWESVYSSNTYPKKIDRDEPYYSGVLYRK